MTPPRLTTKEFVEAVCSQLWARAAKVAEKEPDYAAGLRDAVREVTRAVHRGGPE